MESHPAELWTIADPVPAKTQSKDSKGDCTTVTSATHLALVMKAILSKLCELAVEKHVSNVELSRLTHTEEILID